MEEKVDKKHVIAVLEEIAVLLELMGENPFKVRSYANCARALEQNKEDIESLVRENRLREIKGVGEGIEKKIAELVTTGRMAYYEEIRGQVPESLFGLLQIPGLGGKRIKILRDKLEIISIDELEKACNENRLAEIAGFGKKTQQNILEGIAHVRQYTGLFHLDVATEEAARLRNDLAQDPSVIRIEIAGSIRRNKEVVHDIDILVSSDKPKQLMERFVHIDGVQSVVAQGDTKSSVLMASGIAADLRVVSDEQFPYALNYFTGSKAHNVALRQRAKADGLKLNEYGLFRDDKNVPCKDENAIYAKLGLPYIPPELREDTGELEASAMPKLVELNDIIGMFHCHSKYSDGVASIEEMAKATRDRGYKYLTMTDHSQSAAYAGGLKPETVLKQHEEIDALNKKTKGFVVLKGVESDIRADGALDYDDSILAKFDLIIASVHSQMNMTEDEATARIVKAIENPYTTILGHPTGRLLLKRDGYPLNIGKVLDACAANKVAVEINAHCWRLDLDWRHVKRAKEKGVKLCIGPDAHHIEDLDFMKYGVGIARKGWLEKADVLNCMTAKEFLAWRKR